MASNTAAETVPSWRPQYVLDLSHDLHPGFPWIPVPGVTFAFEMKPIATIEKAGVAANEWRIHEHLGTQIDAPSHFAAGGRGLERLRPDELFAPIAVIDFRAQARANADAVIEISHLRDWEERHGRIPERAIVVMNSGWGARIDDPRAFVNADEDGTMHFPGFSESATLWLVEERDVWGLGVDTISFDPGYDKRYRSHRVLAARDRWAIEAMANLDELPPSGATLFVGAVNVRDATGGLVRPVALWSDGALPVDGVPRLDGRWESRSPEPLAGDQGLVRHLVRRFVFEDERWSIDFSVHADRTLEAPLLSGHNAGTFVIGRERSADGAFHARFEFDERRLTPGTASIARALEAAGCGTGEWRIGQSQDVLDGGCEAFRVFAKERCPAEHDIVRIERSMLHLGARPADGSLCAPHRRPRLADAPPLVRVD